MKTFSFFRRNIFYFLSILCIQFYSCGEPNHEYMTFEIEGIERTARIIYPRNVSPEAPVIFYFHGYGWDAERSDIERRFQHFWPEAVVVYANGIAPYRSNLPGRGWKIRFPYIHEHCGEENDLLYIDTVLDGLRTRLDIDDDKIFAVGHSSGGFFTFSLMELKPDIFKGFTVLGAYSRFSVDHSIVDCDPLVWSHTTHTELTAGNIAPQPRPVLYMFGVLEIFDYDHSDYLRSYSSSCREDSRFRNTVDELLIRNGIDIPDCPPNNTAYIKNVDRQIFQPQLAGAEVQIQLYHGNHSWDTYDNASYEVVEFFKSL